ncbi:MAG TPA: FAD-binding domain [Candidatus Limnocylindrales bacterium]|nr:FAD-binding domain [Candidatus Limnocylindrales bacterium]
MRILISGAGIAGPALAFWLLQYGFEPTIVEVAPHFRTGGYIIDFWGAGFDVAHRMGLSPELQRKGYKVTEVKVVNAAGKRIAGFGVKAFDRMTAGRFISLPRGELAASIFAAIADKAEAIFGDSIETIHQNEKSVRVAFKSGLVRDFDLVVGADGLHSRVRELVFGPEDRFEKFLGYRVAAFEVDGYRPRDELNYVMYTEVGQQVGRFAMRGDRTMFIFTFSDPEKNSVSDTESAKALLRRRFGNSGWECPQILAALDSCKFFYSDRVSQIRMSPADGLWSRGRVTLLGDAASCVSLLAGQGTSLAMVAAYILAGELHRANGDYAAAFARYQNLFGPFVLKKQDAAIGIAGAFAPKSRLSMFLRNQVFNLLSVNWIADYFVGRDLADKITLPDYR